jgi:dethiobiotin synthetase
MGLKPIASGDRTDAEALCAAAGGVWSVEKINPVWFREPAAPWLAARTENKGVDLDLISKLVREACSEFSHVAVEGVGGWRVPLTETESVREWAVRMNLPVVIVARAGLGTLNHTLLTVESIEASGLECRGVILNVSRDPDSFPVRTNPEALRAFTSVPVWEFTRERELAGELPDWLR